MVTAEEFLKCCIEALEANFGQLSNEIIAKIKTKKNITDKSKIKDLKEFLNLIEKNVSVIAGKNKAAEICNSIRAKTLNRSDEMTEEAKAQNMVMNADLEKEIRAFLTTHTLPTEPDISDYTKFLTLKYDGNVRVQEKDVIEKVKEHVRTGIKINILSDEISKFLEKYPQPQRSDVDDFAKYMNLLKLGIDENLMREELEKERLNRKFHEYKGTSKTSELDQFVTSVKRNNDREAVGKLMQTQGLSYLIKDEKGVSDKSLTEFIEIVAPNESDMKDALEGMGLRHLIKNKP